MAWEERRDAPPHLPLMKATQPKIQMCQSCGVHLGRSTPALDKCSTALSMGWGISLSLWSMGSTSIRTYILLSLLWFIWLLFVSPSTEEAPSAEASELPLVQAMVRMTAWCSSGGGPWPDTICARQKVLLTPREAGRSSLEAAPSLWQCQSRFRRSF